MLKVKASKLFNWRGMAEERGRRQEASQFEFLLKF